MELRGSWVPVSIRSSCNLVENALRHTPKGTQIRISLEELGRRAGLVVEDNGPGVPEAERERILRRFYRREQSRTTPGSGLGLGFVAAVAALHGADLRLEDAGPGLRISMRFGSSEIADSLDLARSQTPSAVPVCIQPTGRLSGSVAGWSTFL